MELSITEAENNFTTKIDECSSTEIVKMINDEDKKVAEAVEKCLPQIAFAVDIITNNFLKGGRLFYFGAGTSGRLGVLDASECPPTFSVSPGMVQGIIAGGDKALRYAIEGAEDSEDFALNDFTSCDISVKDTIVVISASGNAKYILKIIELANEKGIKTIAVTSNKVAMSAQKADIAICVETGAEVIAGSTRMKAGTAQKMVLNMLTTASMIQIGKVYDNLMIDVNPTNAKLKDRAARIVSKIAEVSEDQAQLELINNGYKIKHAILKLKYNLEFDLAEEILTRCKQKLKDCFKTIEGLK